MNATTNYLPVTVGSGKAVHLGADRGNGYGPSVDCGAVRYRNITTRSITRQAAGTEATCTKCLKAAAARAEEQAPAEVPAPAKKAEQEVATPEAPVVQRVALGTFKEPKAAAAKAPKVKAPKEEAPAPTSQIGKGVVRFTLTTEEAGTVAYTSGSQINRDYAKAVEEGRPAVLRTIKGWIIRQNQPTA